MAKWNETAAKAEHSFLETQASQTQYVNEVQILMHLLILRNVELSKNVKHISLIY